MFKWLENNQKKENISWHIKFYEIQISVSIKIVYLFMDTDICIGL